MILGLWINNIYFAIVQLSSKRFSCGLIGENRRVKNAHISSSPNSPVYSGWLTPALGGLQRISWSAQGDKSSISHAFKKKKKYSSPGPRAPTKHFSIYRVYIYTQSSMVGYERYYEKKTLHIHADAHTQYTNKNTHIHHYVHCLCGGECLW